MTFDLLNEPWIPVRELTDKTTEVGLLEAVAGAHRYSAFAAESPIVNISLLRLLVAFSQRVFGPGDATTWADLWNKASFDETAVNNYAAAWSERFDLFGDESPFFQCPELDAALAKPISILRLAQANNPTLFDHTNVNRPDPMRPADAARWLVTLQYFDVGGTKTNALGGKATATAAPLVGAIVVTAQGSNLFETLMLNMVRIDPPNDKPFPSTDTDAPAWERATPTLNPTERRPDGHLDWLTFQTRRVRLLTGDSGLVDQVVVTPGDRLAALGQADVEQYIPYRLTKDKNASTPWVPVRLDPRRAVWRNASAMITPSSSTRRRPRVMDWLDELRQDGHLDRTEFTLAAGGVANDKSQYLMWRLEHHPIPATLLANEDLGELLEDAVQLAGSIGFAIERALQPSDSDDEHTGFGPGGCDRAETDYWALAGQGFDDLIAGLATDPTGAAQRWAVHLQSSANAAIRPLIASGTGRHLRRVASTERRLRSRVRTALANFDDTLESLT